MARRRYEVFIGSATVAATTAVGAVTDLLTAMVPVSWIGRYALPLVLGGILAVMFVGLMRSLPSGLPGKSESMRARKVATATGGDGAMALVVVTESNELLYSIYQEPGSWSQWQGLQHPEPVADVAAVTTATDRIEVFCCDNAGRVWWNCIRRDQILSWKRIPGNPKVGRVVALSALSGWMGHREIYVVGEHGKVAHVWRWHEQDWPSWQQSESVSPCRDVALSVPDHNLLECFVVGVDGKIRNRWYDMSAEPRKWSDWDDGFGVGLHRPTIAIDVLNGWKGHQEVFAVRADGGLSHRYHWQDGTRPQWSDLGVPTLGKDVAAGTTSPGHLEVLIADRDGQLWQRSYTDEDWWGEWHKVAIRPTERRRRSLSGHSW